MFEAADPLKPRAEAFEEGWHAQVLAIADTMVKGGHFSANDWAKTLGAALKDADADGKPDTTETYYHCALTALERLSADHASISKADQSTRAAAWRAAYLNTPHGQPVKLGAKPRQT